MIALSKAVTPAIHATPRFLAIREEEGSDIRALAESNPSGCTRRYSVRSLQDRTAPTVTNSLVEEVSETFEVVVAYARDARFGTRANLAVVDVAASDQRQIHHVLHVANSPAGATVLRLGDEIEDISGAPVVFAVNRYRVDYFWSLT
jgi:hypothetical protein